MQDIRVAAASIPFQSGNISGNLARIVARMEEAARQKVDLIIFPEGILSGYDLDIIAQSALEFDGVVLQDLAKKAEALNLIVSVGFLEKEAQNYYVSQAYLGQGVRLRHRKCHRTAWEKKFCQPGEELAVQDLGSVRTGTLICYDTAFPQAAETLAKRGAELLISPTCHCMGKAEVEKRGVAESIRIRREHVRKYWGARAYDYTLYTAYVDSAGETPKGEWHTGYIAFFDPNGELIAENATGQENMVVVDLSGSRLAAARANHVGHFHVLAEARPELYR
jgi:predicted amidohydrolase